VLHVLNVGATLRCGTHVWFSAGLGGCISCFLGLLLPVSPRRDLCRIVHLERRVHALGIVDTIIEEASADRLTLVP